MEYNGVELILDNFRSLLFDMSVDVQDVVRSAILDGIDISEHIVPCRENPYRLDQIRLAYKDGLSKSLISSTSGEMLYRLRRLRQRGVDLSGVEVQLENDSLSDEYMEYMLDWVSDGIDIHGLNLAIIPKNLLKTFDYGLRQGFDMRPYNTGYSYSPEYVKLCLMISKNGKDVSFLLKGDYDLSVLRDLSGISKISDQRWGMLVGNIDSGISEERLELLIPFIKSGVSIVKLQSKVKKPAKGGYVYDCDCLRIVYNAYLSKLDYKKLIEETTDAKRMESMVTEMSFEKRRNPGVRLHKN